MRLIDADSMTLDMPMYNKFSVGMSLEERFRIMLERQPTVESVPIEWFEQHIKELDTELQSLYSRFCSQGDSKEKNEALLRSVTLRTTLTAYETVLSEWRKENEIS